MKKRNSSKNLHNSSSRIKNNTLDLVDRISVLPDSILGLIMSYLPTKNAVATAILSKRWKSVWMTIHNLDFCLDNRRNGMLEDLRNEMPEDADADMKFAQFVDRVLLLLDGELLNKFRLVWVPRFVPSQVSSWITTTITRNVRDLFVSVWVPYKLNSSEPSVKHKVLEMPASVFNAYSLQCLELNGSIIVPAETVVSLPSLESLKLVSVYFQSEEDFENLICGCPKLDFEGQLNLQNIL